MQRSIQILALRATSEEELAERITIDHGLFVPLSDAWQALGYASQGAAQRAAAGDKLGVACIQIPGRKARVVRSIDLARWLFRHFGKDEQK